MTAICTNKCDSKPMLFLSDDITYLTQLYLFGHVAGASPEDDCRIAFLAAIRKPRPDGNDKKRTP